MSASNMASSTMIKLLGGILYGTRRRNFTLGAVMVATGWGLMYSTWFTVPAYNWFLFSIILLTKTDFPLADLPTTRVLLNLPKIIIFTGVGATSRRGSPRRMSLQQAR